MPISTGEGVGIGVGTLASGGYAGIITGITHGIGQLFGGVSSGLPGVPGGDYGAYGGPVPGYPGVEKVWDFQEPGAYEEYLAQLPPDYRAYLEGSGPLPPGIVPVGSYAVPPSQPQPQPSGLPPGHGTPTDWKAYDPQQAQANQFGSWLYRMFGLAGSVLNLINLFRRRPQPIQGRYGYPYPVGGQQVAFIPTSPASIFGGLTDLASGIADTVSALAPAVQPGLQLAGAFGAGPYAGGGAAMPVSQSLPGGAVPALGVPFVDLVPPGSVPITPTQGACGTRLPGTVQVPYTTASGQQKIATYKNMGRAVLYAGDFAACKRVRKVASKARRRSGGR